MHIVNVKNAQAAMDLMSTKDLNLIFVESDSTLEVFDIMDIGMNGSLTKIGEYDDIMKTVSTRIVSTFH